MKRINILRGSMLVAFLVGVTMLPLWASASENGNTGFLGIWEGIDPIDGSDQKVLISEGESGQLNIVWHETFWTVCDGRRAVLKGTGELDPNDKDILIANIVITCLDPDEDVVEDILTFTRGDKALLLTTSENGAFVDLPLYRVSDRVKHGRLEEKDEDQ